jgi:hypothetical protein
MQSKGVRACLATSAVMVLTAFRPLRFDNVAILLENLGFRPANVHVAHMQTNAVS